MIKPKLVVMGMSFGGVSSLTTFLPLLKTNFPYPIVIAMHRHKNSTNAFFDLLDKKLSIPLKVAEDKMELENGTIYFSPSNYHLLIETNGALALNFDPPLNHSRPSIDVLFESASEIFGKYLIGILLTGANDDGANGCKKIKQAGGIVIAENPKTAKMAIMPESAIKACKVDKILDLRDIVIYLNTFKENNETI
ncbi:chemotaxis protein CheB [bacterium]|jgi:two-component system, chemotaxis family, protein-glutamate methylesterase/glutaminase|nr:chemotaxis protein CheB [bacterium]